MDNWKLLAGVIGGTLVLVVGMAFVFSGEETAKLVDQALLVGSARHEKSFGSEEVVMENTTDEITATDSAEASESSKAAKVTIVEFSDFQCPACQSAAPLVKGLLEEYGDGVRLIYRHFPLDSIHTNARAAAVVSEFAADQGLFWPMHDVLFANQEEWGVASDPRPLFEQYLKDLGADVEDLDGAYESERYLQTVQADYETGLVAGVTGTPAFFVDGEQVPVAALSAELSERL